MARPDCFVIRPSCPVAEEPDDADWTIFSFHRQFVDGSLRHIDIALDLANNRSVTLVNGGLVGDGQAIGNGTPGDLRSVTFSLKGCGSASIGIDNIR